MGSRRPRRETPVEAEKEQAGPGAKGLSSGWCIDEKLRQGRVQPRESGASESLPGLGKGGAGCPPRPNR